MRVLLFSTSPRAFRTGGMETVFRTLAAALRERGHHVDEVHHEMESYRERREGGDVWGLPLRMVRTRYKLPTLRSILECLRSLVWVARCVRRARPDVVNVHFINAYALYFVLLQPFFRYRLVLTSHGSDLMRPSNAVDRMLLPYVLRRADTVTVVADALYSQAISLVPSIAPKVTVIPNGVDFEYWDGANQASKDSPPAACHTVVSVGRLEHVKGHDVLIRAFAAVLDAMPTARLVLIGDGTQRNHLQFLATELKIADHVTFLGSLEPADIRAAFQQADAFVLPSRSEGMGLALLEAMAAGVPVIASAVGGVPDVLQEGEGLLVPPEDSVALASAIVELLSSSKLRSRLSELGRCRAASYSWGQSIVEYERVYRDERAKPMPRPRATPGISVREDGREAPDGVDFDRLAQVVPEIRAVSNRHRGRHDSVGGGVVSYLGHG